MTPQQMASLSLSISKNSSGHRPFLFYLSGRTLSECCYRIAAVAVAWQVYTLTNSAFALGLAGVAQFVPSALLIFVAGHTADRYDRRWVLQVCQVTAGLTAALLAWSSFAGLLNVKELYAGLAVWGAASAFEYPAAAALLPDVASQGELQKGTALSIAGFQLATISGPALGGLACALSPAAPYLVMAFFWFLSATFNGAIKLARPAVTRERATFTDLFSGIGFVRRNPSILGTISLDLFAVLLGGATALLPIYARDILLTGPWGLGILRASPAIGAFVMTILLARHPINRQVGRRMFQAVIVFGLATVVFAVSHSFWLSIAALILMGAADTVSMIIRISLVQLASPSEMRGRVGAVNFLFVIASSQLGEFESGLTATLFGAAPAATLGGIGTILVALLWMKMFPSLKNLERLE